MWEHSLYYDLLEYEGETSLVVAEGTIFGNDGCDKTDTLGTDAVSENILGAGEVWSAATVDCGVSYDGNVG